MRRDRRTWTGHVRDTVVFSILDSEWPKVRLGLERRLAETGGGSSGVPAVLRRGSKIPILRSQGERSDSLLGMNTGAERAGGHHRSAAR